MSDDIMTAAGQLKYALEVWVHDKEHTNDGHYLGDSGYGDYERVLNWFEPFAELPEPSKSESAFDSIQVLAGSEGLPEDAGASLEAMEGGLSSVRGEADTILDVKMSEWKGDAADAFSSFISPMREVPNTQMAVVKVLALVLAANKALVEKAREDAKNIAETGATLASLQSSGVLGNFGAGVNLGVAIAVTGIAGAVVPAAAVPFAMLSGAAITANAFAAENDVSKSPEHKLGAMGPDALARNVKEALDAVEEKFMEGQETLKEVLDSILNAASSDPMNFTAERPTDLTDESGSHEEFRPPPV